ncbi:MAG TPA: element excision factor XisH family protein, partial [Blastocatellia bacterium]
MPAKDKAHQQVVNALRKDGWTITHDPFKVRWKTRKLLVDLGAEKLIAAQKEADKIAVEIKSFVGANDLEDL